MSRKLYNWIKICLQRLHRVPQDHNHPCRYLQSKSNFRYHSPFFFLIWPLGTSNNFMLYVKSWQAKKKLTEWRWKGKITKQFSKNVSLFFCSTLHTTVLLEMKLIWADYIWYALSGNYFSCTYIAFTSILSLKYWHSDACWKIQLKNYRLQ